MRYCLFYFLGFIFLFSCEIKKDNIQDGSFSSLEIPKGNPLDTLQHQKNYERLLAEIKIEKRELKNKSYEIQKEKFQEFLVDSIFKYWYRTPWDFNGHTNEPRNGLVACGYFVSTPLRHLGLKINRYKIAQKAASDIVKALCDNSSIKRFASISDLENHLNQLPENEVLILGLDFHVGFLVRENGKNYFIHSNYIRNAGVMKEDLKTSRAISSSDAYIIGSLTGNKSLVQKWMKN